LQDYRNAVAEAVQILQDYGDKNIIYINSLRIFLFQTFEMRIQTE